MFSQCLVSKVAVPATMIALVVSIPMNEIASPAHADTRERGYQLFPERNLNEWTEGSPFSGVESNAYWSSSADANGKSAAWVVSLNGGYVDSAGNANNYSTYRKPSPRRRRRSGCDSHRSNVASATSRLARARTQGSTPKGEAVAAYRHQRGRRRLTIELAIDQQ